MKKLNAQERVFEIVRLLVENHIEGLTNKELAQKLGTSEVNICRDLALFEQYRWGTRGTKNVWRLSAEFGGISGQIVKSYQKARLVLTKEEAECLAAVQ